MKTLSVMAAAAAFALMSGSPALADCHDDMAAEAPSTMENAPDDTATGSIAGEGIAKDGTTAPLETDDDVAMSSDDVQAQQQGDETAMGEAGTDDAETMELAEGACDE